MKTLNHYIQWEGSERQYVTREEALDTIRACAAVNVRQVAIGNLGERIGDLGDDKYFSSIKIIIAKDGLNENQRKIAIQTLVPEIYSEGNSLWDNRDMEMRDCSVEIKKAISVWAEWRKGIGKRIRFVYCVQSSEVDDAVFESHSLRAALLDAAIRLERRRVLQIFDGV